MNPRATGLMIVTIGVCAVIVGLLIYSGALSWFGRLPGDIRMGSERTRVFIPLTSMLIVSLVLSLILYVVRRYF